MADESYHGLKQLSIQRAKAGRKFESPRFSRSSPSEESSFPFPVLCYLSLCPPSSQPTFLVYSATTNRCWSVYACAVIVYLMYSCSWRPGEGGRAPRSGVTQGELPDTGVGILTLVLWKSSKLSQLLSHLSRLPRRKFISHTSGG